MTTAPSEVIDSPQVFDSHAHHDESAESRTTLLARVEHLPARQQEALRLRFSSGLSYAEIAEVMDITVTHVGVMLHQAIKTLRESSVGHLAPRQ